MSHAEAVTVVHAGLPEVEARVRDVESWPLFLGGLVSVVRTGHDRYRFTIRQGTGHHDVDVRVSPRPREHRIAWHVLTGPAWDGEIRMAEESPQRTRVALRVTVEPRGFTATVADLLGGGQEHAELDLQRLEGVLAVGGQLA